MCPLKTAYGIVPPPLSVLVCILTSDMEQHHPPSPPPLSTIVACPPSPCHSIKSPPSYTQCPPAKEVSTI